jgi:hypothetical protein
MATPTTSAVKDEAALSPNITAPQHHQHDFTKFFQVLVGPDEKVFVVHKEVIIARSPFFEAASSERWNKLDQNIKLPEDEPHIFSRYLQCVYQDVVIAKGNLGLASQLTQLVKLYIMADKFGDLTSSNLIIDKFMDDSDKAFVSPGCSLVKYTYSRTAPTSPLRRLMVDYYMHEGGESNGLEIDDAPVDFFRHFCREYQKIRENKWTTTVKGAFGM